MIAIVPAKGHLPYDPGTGRLHLWDQVCGELEILLDPHRRHAWKLSGNVGIAGKAVEISAEVADLHDLHPTPAHVIEDPIGRRQRPVFDEAIEPESRVHCSPLSPPTCQCRHVDLVPQDRLLVLPAPTRKVRVRLTRRAPF